eukprot:89128_1
MADACHIIAFWLLMFHYYSTNALNTIDCSENDACRLTRILCDTDDDCHIICNTSNACTQKTFICPTDNYKTCEIDCIGSACLHTTFDASNSFNGQLKLSIISNGLDDVNAWSYGSLLCPPNGDCTIVSTSDTIQHNHISALHSQSLNITIIGTDTQSNALYQSNVYCPLDSGMYCDINIHQGMLSNANIYTTQHQYLWIICNTNTQCYDAQHPPTLYCGSYYQSECEILSDDDLTQCVCYGSSNADDPTTSTQHMSTDNPNTVIHVQSTTADDLRYVIVILSSVIVLSLFAVCGFGILTKMKRTVKRQRDTDTQSFPSASYTNSNVSRLSIKRMSDVKFLQSDTSMVSPNSMQSGVSSVQYTVNNLFGKEKEQQIQVIQPPIPPVAAPVMPGQSVGGFGSAWNMNNTTPYFGGTYALSANNPAPISYSGVIDIQRSAPIIIPGAPYRSHGRQPSTRSESESNLMAMPYVSAATNQLHNIALDGDVATDNCVDTAQTQTPDVCDTNHTMHKTEHVTDDAEDTDSSHSSGTDGCDIDNDTNELFLQLKRARYYKAKKSHVYARSTSASKSHDPSIQTMIIKEDECEYRFGPPNNEVMSMNTNDEMEEAECTQYTIEVTKDVEAMDQTQTSPDEGQLECDVENTQTTTNLMAVGDDADTAEYSFTENTSLTDTHTHTESESESRSQCTEKDENKDEAEDGHNSNVVSVIYSAGDL